jgi:lantibiotic modifying enzyme
LAGTLYAGSVVGAPLRAQRELLDKLAGAAVVGPVGSCWPDPSAADQRPLCGLAHGASGVALALAEAAAQRSILTADARSMIGAALAWERAWFDPIRGSWPDLRGDSISYPAWWCHGAAGIGLVRLRLLVLQRADLDLGLSEPSLLAEAGAAIRAGSAELASALAGGGHPAGLTLCHGAGGVLELLTLAAEVFDVEEHLLLGQQFAAQLLAGLDRDPLRWTTGLPVLGGGGLFLGLGGAAAVLARLAFPGRRIPPVALP